MTATPPWTCDTCGQPITSVEDGWVEWLSRSLPGDDYKRQDHSLRLVHKRHASPRSNTAHACYYNKDQWYQRDKSTVSDLPLSSFLDSDGLMILLEFASDGRFELDELIEMIKRLHIPGYDQARNSFEAAISDGTFEPNTKPGFYRQENIQDTLRWKQRRDAEQ